MDFNDFLRNTKTAAEESRVGGGGVLKVPLVGRKRGSTDGKSPGQSPSTDATAKRPRRSGTMEGLNLQAAQDALAQERGSTSAQAQQQRVQADLASEQAAARMVHQVLDYVMSVELGGRHNAAKGGLPPFVPTTAQLAAERAMWTPSAGYTMHHVVPAASDASGTAALEALVSVVEKERVPEGMRLLRSSLQMCDVACDMVGGVRARMAPHLRAHVLDVLERGLRGEAWLRDDSAAAAADFSALGKPATPDRGPSSVLLFRDSTDVKGEEGVRDEKHHTAVPPGGFSLTAFLDGRDTSSSALSGEDEEEGD